MECTNNFFFDNFLTQIVKTKHMYKNILFFGLIAFLFASCSNMNSLKVKNTNFEEEVQRAQNLVFTFNKDLLQDTLLFNKWDTLPYVEFKPAIAGRFMWTAKNEITFSPLGAMPPATKFTATLTKNLLFQSKTKYAINDEPIVFHTPLIKVENTNSFWAISGELTNNIEVRTQIKFNNPISPIKLKPLLKLKVNGKEQPFRILSQNVNELIEIAFEYNTLDPNNDAKGNIEIVKGLSCEGGTIVTTDAIQTEFSIPSKDKLEINGIEPGFDQGKGFINVYTSQPIVFEGIKAFVSVEPALDFLIEPISNGFVIKGDFLASQTYNLLIRKGLLNVFGIQMKDDFTSVASFADPVPAIQFTEKTAMYLSSQGARNLGVSIINVPSVKVSVFKIFENNIQHYLRQGKSWDYYYEEDEYYDFNTWTFDENYGKPVMSKIVQTRSLQKIGNISLLNLDLQELNFNESFKGLYLVKVEATDRKFIQDVQLLSLSDLGLIVKQGAQDVMVFVNSLKDASPVRGARVDFISSNNQKVFSASTDGNGVAVFKNAKQVAAGFKLSMVTVKYANDFNFLLFDKTRVETSRYDAGGKHTDNLNYDVFIYGDRNLYRPGDSIHFNTIVRTLRWEVVSGIPIKIRLLAPNGREYLNVRKQLNASGAVATDFFIPLQAMTGTYNIEVYSANDVLLGSRNISVEEFVPDRIKVSSKPDKEVYLPAENIKVAISADNLYGTPARNRKFETELRLSRKQLICKQLPDYIFNIDSKNIPILSSMLKQGTTDDEGKALGELQSAAFKDIGLLEGKIYTTVFDETGRPVNRLNIIEIPTQHVYVGIKNFDSWLSTRKSMNLQFAATDRMGKILPSAQVRVVILYYTYQTVIENSYGRYNYVSQRKEKVMYSKDLVIKGVGSSVPFIPNQSGEYEVRIMLPGSDSYVSKTFYAYGWNDTNFSSFEVSREGEVAITTDKNNYAPGEKAKILFKAPFDGQMLVTIEQENVLTYKFVTLINKSASMDLSVTSDFLPNVYISATAFRKVTDISIPLTVAHGILSIKVDDPSNKLQVSIAAPEKSKSGVKQVFSIKTLPNAELTIAVVDEGILQVTDFKTPDPFGFFYQKRALGVNSFDVYALLFPELRKSSPAGGEAFDLSKRINPLTGERIKLISKWSGIRKANSSGLCSFEVEIPQFSGALRVMAVAYKGKQFGAAEKTMKVADPIIVSMAAPRFLSPGDKCLIAVNLTNTTEKGTKASVQLSADGALVVAGVKSNTVELNSKAEEVLVFEVDAGNSVGNSTIIATVNALGHKFSQRIVLPVRPAAGFSYITGAGNVVAGKSTSFKPVSDMMPKGSSSMLVVSKSPAIELGRSLNYLIRYPYGCLEQTVSCAFPQLYLSDIFNLMPSTKNTSEMNGVSANYNVQQAIAKIESRQLFNGGFSMWPEGGNADWWATSYAIHFLLEAKNAGYDVNKTVLNNSLKYLSQRVKERETETYFYTLNGVIKSRVVPSQELFYSMYVLALADQPAISAMNYYKSLLNELSIESRYLLAASYMLSGDTKTYRVVLPPSFGSEIAVTTFGGAYSSYLRNKAIALNAMLETDANNPQVTVLLKGIMDEFAHARYFSTQEASFALLAIGKHARKAAKMDITAQILVDGKLVETYKNADLKLSADIANHNVAINTTGNGNLYYYYELSGIKLNPITKDEDSYMKVRRRFLDRNGNEIKSKTFQQNDLVVVEVTAESEDGKSIKNVAITDILPACFEIENSRLVSERELDFLKNRSVPDYTDIRDDRISFFTELNQTKKVFYYTVRVVSRGSFVLGAVSADAMYNGLYHSYSGSGRIMVK